MGVYQVIKAVVLRIRTFVSFFIRVNDDLNFSQFKTISYSVVTYSHKFFLFSNKKDNRPTYCKVIHTKKITDECLLTLLKCSQGWLQQNNIWK